MSLNPRVLNNIFALTGLVKCCKVTLILISTKTISFFTVNHLFISSLKLLVCLILFLNLFSQSHNFEVCISKILLKVLFWYINEFRNLIVNFLLLSIMFRRLFSFTDFNLIKLYFFLIRHKHFLIHNWQIDVEIEPFHILVDRLVVRQEVNRSVEFFIFFYLLGRESHNDIFQRIFSNV